jgi:hypothetical protein
LRGWRPQGRGGSNPPFRTNLRQTLATLAAPVGRPRRQRQPRHREYREGCRGGARRGIPYLPEPCEGGPPALPLTPAAACTSHEPSRQAGVRSGAAFGFPFHGRRLPASGGTAGWCTGGRNGGTRSRLRRSPPSGPARGEPGSHSFGPRSEQLSRQSSVDPHLRSTSGTETRNGYATVSVSEEV